MERTLKILRNGLMGLAMIGAQVVFAQHQEVPEKPAMWKGKAKIYYDTGALAKAFEIFARTGNTKVVSIWTFGWQMAYFSFGRS